MGGGVREGGSLKGLGWGDGSQFRLTNKEEKNRGTEWVSTTELGRARWLFRNNQENYHAYFQVKLELKAKIEVIFRYYCWLTTGYEYLVK